MSVVIRLSATGKTHAISFRIAVQEKWSKRDGKYVELLGFYNPFQRDDSRFKIDKARFDYWVSKGAKASPAVEELIETNGNPKPKPVKARPKKEAAPAAAPAEAAAAPATDQPAPEEKAPEPAAEESAPAAEAEKEEIKVEAEEEAKPAEAAEAKPEQAEPKND